MKKRFLEFLQSKNITETDYAEKTAEEMAVLQNEYNEKLIADLETEISVLKKGDKAEAVKTIQDQLKDIDLSKIEKASKDIAELFDKFDELKEKGGQGNGKHKTIKSILEENADDIKDIKKVAGGVNFEVAKATQGSADITGREIYAEVEQGTNRKPFRKLSILDLFKRRKLNKERLMYREEDAVTRDGKVVIACANSVHNTKKEWVTRESKLAKIRDMVDVCEDMIDDFDFVEGEIKELTESAVKSKEEQEVLNGTGEVLSIDTISSEFTHANPLATFTGAFEDANVEQLVDAMTAQIAVFGQENKWQPNVVLMSFIDFVKYRNLKDKNGNKLIHTLSDNVATIGGCRVVTSPLVAPNTLYVMDTEQGEILERDAVSVSMAYENKDNFEHETITIKAVERMQFHVKQIDRDAFMKCSDVAIAISQINKV